MGLRRLVFWALGASLLQLRYLKPATLNPDTDSGPALSSWHCWFVVVSFCVSTPGARPRTLR